MTDRRPARTRTSRSRGTTGTAAPPRPARRQRERPAFEELAPETATAEPEVLATARPQPPGWLPLAGLVVGVWGALPFFLTPPLNTRDVVEIVDHVIPGLVVLAVCTGAVLLQRRPDRGGSYLFFGGLVMVLAGLWMTVTHVPLVSQATREEAPWAGTIYHSASALAVLGFSVIWMAAHWNSADVSDD